MGDNGNRETVRRQINTRIPHNDDTDTQLRENENRVTKEQVRPPFPIPPNIVNQLRLLQDNNPPIRFRARKLQTNGGKVYRKACILHVKGQARRLGLRFPFKERFTSKLSLISSNLWSKEDPIIKQAYITIAQEDRHEHLRQHNFLFPENR